MSTEHKLFVAEEQGPSVVSTLSPPRFPAPRLDPLREAVIALRKLTPAQGHTAYARVVRERWDDWAAARGLRRSRGSTCPLRLIGRRCRSCHERSPCRPPCDDHAKLWLRDGEPYMYSFEPYVLDDDSLKRLAAYCDLLGFHARLTADSIHNAHGTVMVELRRLEDGKAGW